MTLFRLGLTLSLLALLSLGLRAQGSIDLSNSNIDSLRCTSPLTLTQGSFFPSTLRATSSDGKKLAFGVTRKAETLSFEVLDCPNDSLVVWDYRVFKTQWREPVANLDSTRLYNQKPLNPFSLPSQRSTTITALQEDLKGIDYRGTFGRGLRFGNTQNLVLDSKLDLQVNGDLGDGLSVSAVVSDQNIPIQPEGNTVQLREFDRVFVTLKKSKHSLTAGDYQLNSSAGHFLRFNKNLQGLTYQYNDSKNISRIHQGRASVAASRGNFQQIRLPLTNGNQGPYRLTGARNEPFVLVLAGTERITLDGRLLERGIDRDYTIDYNRGEITFTPSLLINSFQRIIVEYEYADREYLRTLSTAEASTQQGAWKFYAQGLQQQDGLRRTGVDLSPEAEQILQAASGNNLGVLVPSATLIDQESLPPVSYNLIADTSTACPQLDSIFILAINDDLPLYSVTFTEVGIGLGDYSRATDGEANGIYFKYVPRGPNCERQGSFVPQISVQTPQSLRIGTVGGAYTPDSTTYVSWELVANQLDLNRFNSASKNSWAGHGAFAKTIPVKDAQLTLQGSVEGTANRFQGIAPWRSTEFNRTWNLGNLATQSNFATGNDRLANLGASFQRNRLVASYSLDQYKQAENFSGLRQAWTIKTNERKWSFVHHGSVLNADRNGITTGNSSLNLSSRHVGKRWNTTAKASRTTSKNYDLVTDNTSSLDRQIYEWSIGTESVEATDTTWSQNFSYTGRSDNIIGDTTGMQNLQIGTKHQLEATLQSPQLGLNDVSLTATYRHDPTDASNPSNYYLSRINHRFKAKRKGWLTIQTSTEVGSGQERRIALQYLRVQPGLGEYTWRDYDGDGQEDLDEFEVAVFSDSATYIKTITLTEDFVATNTLGLNQSINVNLDRLKGKDKSWWQKYSAVNTLSLKRRSLQQGGYAQLFRLSVPTSDTLLVGNDLSWRTALFYNRARNTFRFELEQRRLENRTISLQGLQELNTQIFTGSLMQPIKNAWRIASSINWTSKSSSNEGLASRNFEIQNFEFEPSLSYQPSTGFDAELIVGYRNGWSKEEVSTVEARSLALNIDIRVTETKEKKRFLNGATLRSHVERVDQTFSGEVDSPVGFALLEGLRPGQSWIWNLSLDQQLGRSLQLSLRYDGRQLGSNRVAHTGQAQLQAIF